MVDERKVDALTDTSAALAQRAEILVRATNESNERHARRWRNTSLILLVGIGILIWIALISKDRQDKNAEILNDVDVLVEFVEEVKADQSNGPSPQTQQVFQAIFDIKQAICTNPEFTCPE